MNFMTLTIFPNFRRFEKRVVVEKFYIALWDEQQIEMVKLKVFHFSKYYLE